MQLTRANFSILAIIGPSGSGKSTTIRQLDKKLIEVVPSWTTRPPRPDETKGLEHTFVSETELFRARDAGLLLETRQLFGLPFWYGLPVIDQPKQGKIAVIVLRASLIDLFSKHYSNYIIYQIEDTLPRVKQRLLDRKIHGEELGTRLHNFEEEIVAGHKLAKRSFTNNMDNTNLLAQAVNQAILEDFR